MGDQFAMIEGTIILAMLLQRRVAALFPTKSLPWLEGLAPHPPRQVQLQVGLR